MSILVKQLRCPECAKLGKDKKGDNLAEYSDGHQWCYSCGYYVSAKGVQKFLTSQEHKEKHEVFLPSDCSTEYPQQALNWIKQYEINKNDLLHHGTLWSESRSRLIFPIYGDEENLIAYQGRYFGVKDEPKWFGKGNLKDTFNILGRSSPLSLIHI